MDPYLCCLLGLCCAENSPQQVEKLSDILVEQGIVATKADGLKVAAFHVALVAHAKAKLKADKG